MNQQRHIIKKQVLELLLSSSEGAFELQNEISRIYRSKIVPLIDTCLSQLSASDEIYRIDRLEINLGNIDINNLEEEFIAKFKQEIRQLIEQNRERSPLFASTGSRSNQTTSQLELFSYFIQTGNLPWWSQKLSKQELEKSCDRLLKTSPEQVKLIFAESFKQEKYSRRIIYQFSDSTLLKITQLFASNLYNFITNYHNDIQQIYKKKIDILANIPPSKFRLEFWRGIFFTILFEQYTRSQNVQFTRNHLLHIATSFRLNYLLLIDKMLEAAENLKQEGRNLKSQLPEILTQINSTVSRENSSIASESEQSINLEEARSRSAAEGRSQPEDTLTNTVAPFSDSEEIYIYNSGLVLLWPFLARFFETLELIQEGHFINSESAERAVLILQYLVDGVTEIPEYLLSLNKILCGIDLLEPVATNLAIAEQERHECEHLLSAVISNWSILKNTSLEGFRRAFLQREGILRVRDGSWLLQVEQETYDVLLDRIPWSISAVKLPWMNELIYVEW
ncbi:MAG: contractile injection system tape measure protein [Prochloraceae cyanobacterium]|nr:contractile injection system tape measure protein [Prochloraceae cyanobacterium]